MPQPIPAYAIYKPLPGKEEQLGGLMKDFIAALHSEGFSTGHAVIPPNIPEGYLVAGFEWADNSEELEEEAGNHPRIKALKAQMASCSFFPDMKELKRISSQLRQA